MGNNSKAEADLTPKIFSSTDDACVDLDDIDG